MKFEKPMINISMFMIENLITASGNGPTTLEEQLDVKAGPVKAKQFANWDSMTVTL